MAKAAKPVLGKIKNGEGAGVPTWMKAFVWGVAGCALMLGFWAVGLGLGRDGDVARFAAQGWGQYAEAIVGNKIRALWHAAFMTTCAAAFLWLFLLARPRKAIVYRLAQWGLVLLVAGDAWMLSRHYVKTMPLSALDENPVISMLKKDSPVHRCALVSQDGFYNWWLTIAFPYHGIQTVNVTQMPRMPVDYKNFMTAVGRNPIRYWQLAAVGYVLAPVQVWDQIQKDPSLRNTFDLVYRYNAEHSESGVAVEPVQMTGGPVAKHVVLRFKQPGPRYALVSGWTVCDDDETLRQLADTRYVPFQKAILAKNSVTNRPSSGGGEGLVGKVQSMEYKSGYFHLKTSADQSAILRVAERYDRNWKAIVDGRPAKVLRVDYIFQGLYLTPGEHDVILKYSADIKPLYVQLAGMLVCAVAALVLGIKFVLRKIRGEK